jgi:hypothetical protein
MSCIIRKNDEYKIIDMCWDNLQLPDEYHEWENLYWLYYGDVKLTICTREFKFTVYYDPVDQISCDQIKMMDRINYKKLYFHKNESLLSLYREIVELTENKHKRNSDSIQKAVTIIDAVTNEICSRDISFRSSVKRQIN